MWKAAFVAVALVACTSPGHPDPARTAAVPPATATPSLARTERLAYRSDLAPGATYTLAGASNRLHLLDERGNVVWSRSLPRGRWAHFSRANGRTYVVGDDWGTEFLYTYDDRSLTALPGGALHPHRFASGGAVYRATADLSKGEFAGENYDLVRDLPRRGRWHLPDIDPLAPGVKGALGMGRDVGPGEPLAVVTTRTGPLVVLAMDGRCSVLHAGEGRQVVIDAPAPYHWELCGDAAVDTDGRLTILAQDAGAYYEPDRRDRVVLLHVDPVTLAVERQVLFAVPQQIGGWAIGELVALPGGLVAHLTTRGREYVVDLRGPEPVRHRIPVLGNQTAAAGPDAIFVWGYFDDTQHKTVARVDVRTGRVERAALTLTDYVSGVIRVAR